LLFMNMKSDAEKWNAKYSLMDSDLPSPDEFLFKHKFLLHGGRASDIACGLGENSIFLAKNNYQVDAVDISSVALDKLRFRAVREHLPITCIYADLDHYNLTRCAYDLIIVFYFYLERMLSQIKAALKPGGMLFYATYNINHKHLVPTFNYKYLIEPKALATYFHEYEILINQQFAGEYNNVTRIITKKPEI
jgi:tellurite methyltransferase